MFGSLLMKVLFVTREYPPFEVGGVAVQTFNLVENLRRIGISCKVLSFGDPAYSNREVMFIPPSSSIISRSNCSINSDFKIPLDIIRMTRIANKLIKTERFDVVHVEEPFVGAFVRHKRKVTTVHDTSYGQIKSLLRSNKSFTNVKRVAFYFSLGLFLELMGVVSSTIMITPSKQRKKELIETYHVPPNKVVVLRNGVNLPELSGLDNRRIAKEKLCLPSDKLLIFTTSQHIPRKRLDTLLNAISLLQSQKVAEYQVVIAGDGPVRPFLANLGKKLKLDGIVRFPGWVSREKLELYYQATDIFVLTSEYEAGPITLLEAMSFGNAAVSSRIDGFPSLLINNINSLLFPVGNHYDLSKCLGLLLNDATLRLKLSASARCFAEKFDWKSVAEDTKNLYERLC